MKLASAASRDRQSKKTSRASYFGLIGLLVMMFASSVCVCVLLAYVFSCVSVFGLCQLLCLFAYQPSLLVRRQPRPLQVLRVRGRATLRCRVPLRPGELFIQLHAFKTKQTTIDPAERQNMFIKEMTTIDCLKKQQLSVSKKQLISAGPAAESSGGAWSRCRGGATWAAGRGAGCGT